MRRIPTTLILTLAACDTASTAIVDNRFDDTFSVERAWWQTTLFDTHLSPGESSSPERTVPGTAVVWAEISSATWPRVAVRSTAALTLRHRGEELHLVMSATTLTGMCGINSPLSPEDAETAALIFPDEFSGSYDPATCTFAGAPTAGP